MSFENVADDSLKEMLEELGSYWEWDKKTLRAIQSDKTDSNVVELQGLEPSTAFTLVLRKLDLTDGIPEVGDIIRDVALNETYRITSVVSSQGDPSINITCSSIDGK
jgi:hypothetical protein